MMWITIALCFASYFCLGAAYYLTKLDAKETERYWQDEYNHILRKWKEAMAREYRVEQELKKWKHKRDAKGRFV